MKKTLVFIVTYLFCASLFAQKAPMKWGKVDQADLEMKTYELEPDADAVVLADYGKLELDLATGEYAYILDHHVRIKILKKSAFKRGDISIPYYSHDKIERISGLSAQVVLPDGKKVKLSKKDFFEEKVNEYWSQKKFAFPKLEEGCIIEYKYTKTSEQIYYLTDWYFQSDIPTRWSEFRTIIPKWFDYVNFNQGLLPEIEESENSKKISIPTAQRESSINFGNATKIGGSINGIVVKKRYLLKDVPSLKEENFITTMNDYYSKLSLQLQSVQFPNSIRQNMSTSWEKVAKDLEKSESFGHQINKKRHTKKLMAAIAPELVDAKDEAEKVAKIYSFIANNIEWNDLNSYTSKSLDDAFEKKLATAGELNLMFIALCRQHDITANPVLISTRSHGKMMKYYPKTDQFNHVIAFVQLGEQQMLFDIGSPYRSPDLLRRSSLNYNGWLVDKDKSEWITIPTPTELDVAMANLELDVEGNLSGKINRRFKGYGAMSGRSENDKNKADHKHIKEEWQKVFPDITFKAIDFENSEDLTKPLACNLEIDILKAAQVSGEFIYVSPMLGLGIDENPLKQEDRTFPVDIPVKSKDQYVLNLTIPEGYAVEELPESVNMKMEGSGGRFQYLVSQNGNVVQVVCKVMITRLQYEPTEYKTVKTFFDLIVEKQGEQIVLKKI